MLMFLFLMASIGNVSAGAHILSLWPAVEERTYFFFFYRIWGVVWNEHPGSPSTSFWLVSKDEKSWIWMVKTPLPVSHISLGRALLVNRSVSVFWSLGLECAQIQQCSCPLVLSFSSDFQALSPVGWKWGLPISWLTSDWVGKSNDANCLQYRI